MTPAPCGLEAGGVAVIPDPGNLQGWPDFERNYRSVAVPDGWFGDDIHSPM
jgi:hypothetical protein